MSTWGSEMGENKDVAIIDSGLLKRGCALVLLS